MTERTKKNRDAGGLDIERILEGSVKKGINRAMISVYEGIKKLDQHVQEEPENKNIKDSTTSEDSSDEDTAPRRRAKKRLKKDTSTEGDSSSDDSSDDNNARRKKKSTKKKPKEDATPEDDSPKRKKNVFARLGPTCKQANHSQSKYLGRAERHDSFHSRTPPSAATSTSRGADHLTTHYRQERSQRDERSRDDTRYRTRSPPTDAEIKDFIRWRYPGALEFLGTFPEPTELGGPSSDKRSCRFFNSPLEKCNYSNTHYDKDKSYMHVCPTCLRILKKKENHPRSDPGCPIKILINEMENSTN